MFNMHTNTDIMHLKTTTWNQKQRINENKLKTRMTLSRVHTSTKTAGVTILLILSECQLAHATGAMPHLTVTITLT